MQETEAQTQRCFPGAAHIQALADHLPFQERSVRRHRLEILTFGASRSEKVDFLALQSQIWSRELSHGCAGRDHGAPGALHGTRGRCNRPHGSFSARVRCFGGAAWRCKRGAGLTTPPQGLGPQHARRLQALLRLGNHSDDAMFPASFRSLVYVLALDP
jgi:hypothetical protein